MPRRTQNEYTDRELMQVYYNLNNEQRKIFDQFKDRGSRGYLHYGRAEALRARVLLVRDSRFEMKSIWVSRTRRITSTFPNGRWKHTWYLDSAGYRLVRLIENGFR